MQWWRSKARVRSAVKNKGAVSSVPWLWHLLWPVSGKGNKVENKVQNKGVFPQTCTSLLFWPVDFLSQKVASKLLHSVMPDGLFFQQRSRKICVPLSVNEAGVGTFTIPLGFWRVWGLYGHGERAQEGLWHWVSHGRMSLGQERTETSLGPRFWNCLGFWHWVDTESNNRTCAGGSGCSLNTSFPTECGCSSCLWSPGACESCPLMQSYQCIAGGHPLHSPSAQ